MRYRIGQFWRNMRAKRLSPDLIQDLRSILSSDQLELFLQLPDEDQTHSYAVMNGLRKLGETDQDLMVAALLHDIGKTRVPVSVWERSLVVLVERVSSDRAEKYASGSPSGWKRAFIVKSQHPHWGAEMAQQAGCSELTISIIRGHHEPLLALQGTNEERLVGALQKADNIS